MAMRNRRVNRLSVLLVAVTVMLAMSCPAYSARRKRPVKSGRTLSDSQNVSEVYSFPVPINRLANYKSLKKKQSDAEFKQAYDEALKIVTPLKDMKREDQLLGIAVSLRNLVDTGRVSYTTSAPHYNDPYGYFVAGVSSCAGCTRATGLCLNILGIPYEHVNENKWLHQWCRVNVNGTYWICDAYGLTCGPEPAPYEHPRFEARQ